MWMKKNSQNFIDEKSHQRGCSPSDNSSSYNKEAETRIFWTHHEKWEISFRRKLGGKITEQKKNTQAEELAKMAQPVGFFRAVAPKVTLAMMIAKLP